MAARSRDRHYGPAVPAGWELTGRGGPRPFVSWVSYRLPDETSTVLLCGYQAAGTRGRALEEGAKTIRLHGQDVAVRAHDLAP